MIYNKTTRKIISSLMAVILIAVSFSGCRIFDEIFDFTEDTTAPSTQVKETVPSNNTGKSLYGFDSISDEKVKILYGMIDKYADGANEEYFTVQGDLSPRQLYEGIYAYKEDHPEVFWLSNNCKFYHDEGNTMVSLNYLMDYETIVDAKAAVKAKVDEIVSNAPSDATQFELELYAHDYIADNCEYDNESASTQNVSDNSGNIYGVLIEGKAVCEGYARAFQLICKRLGIECVNILGISDNVSHMWNCVMIDGEWYQIDVTWDDNEEEQNGLTRYLFFNLNDEAMYKDHQPSKKFEDVSDEDFLSMTSNANLFVPECTATEYNYHLYYGALITDIDDSGEIINDIAQAAKENRDMFYLTVDSSLDFDEVSSKLIEGGYLADWIGSANLYNFYSPNLNMETNVYTISEYNLFAFELQYI